MILYQYFRRLRYNFIVSKILVFLTKPIHTISLIVLQALSTKIKVNGKSIHLAGVKILFPKDIGIGINSKLFWSGMDGYEALTSKSLIIFFNTCDTFIDIGSNFGFYSVLAQKINPKICTYCFEPLPNIYRDNISFHAGNGLAHSNIHNVGISDCMGQVDFFVPNVYSIDSEITSASLEKDFFYNRSFPQKKITVDAITMDYFYLEHKNNLKDKSVVTKIDVEGHEASAMRGAKLFFMEIRPYLIMEVDQSPINVDILEVLFAELHYSFYCLTAVGYFKINFQAIKDLKGGRDFLAMPNEKVVNREFIGFDYLSSLVSDKANVNVDGGD